MKYLIILLSFIISCHSPKQQVGSSEKILSSDTLEIVDDIQVCDVELKSFLKNNLVLIKDKNWNPLVVFKRNDELVNKLQTIYKPCLMGKSPLEINNLFGRSLGFFNEKIIYDFINSADEIKKKDENSMQLIFQFDENKKVKEILFQARKKGFDEVEIINLDKKNDD